MEFEVRLDEDDRWQVRLDGRVVSRHVTQQLAISHAKAKALPRRGRVTWKDLAGHDQGLVDYSVRRAQRPS